MVWREVFHFDREGVERSRAVEYDKVLASEFRKAHYCVLYL
jgi:hypothetical protein